MKIDQGIVNEVLQRTDIVEVIGKSIKLKRSGNNYFGLCPFHKEKSPSFSINTTRQYFHCFGCGESGDALTFIMKHNGLDFIDAVKHLAHECSVPIPESTYTRQTPEQIKQFKQQQLDLRQTITKASKFFQDQLTKTPHALAYLKQRGLNLEIVKKFSLGFAPSLDKYQNPLSAVFNDYNNNQHLIDAGLVILNQEQNKRYDRFRSRIIFPIKSTRGDIIGFGGRIIDKGEPKYLNSPETTLFNKSLELYGLYESGKVIRNKNYVIVVEGYMDVIALNQYGIENVVATMGTAATEEHIKKLFRLCNDIYYCFDGDNAGQKAAWRALERSIPNITDEKAAHFVFLPDNHDPDSFIRKFGVDEFESQVKQYSLPLSSFIIQQLIKDVNLHTEEGKARLISLARPYIEQTRAAAMQVILKNQLAKTVDLPPSVVESILNKRTKYAFYNSKFNNTSLIPQDKLNLATINNIYQILKTVLINPKWIHSYNLPEDISDLSTEQKELVLILDFIDNNHTVDKILNYQELIHLIKVNLSLRKINLDLISNGLVTFSILTQEEFYTYLSHIFGRLNKKVIKVGRIPLKNN